MSADYLSTIPEYRQASWETAFPLPKGKKFPPPENVTGNVPEIPLELLEDWEEDRSNKGKNLGIRMPTLTVNGENRNEDPEDFELFEVIGIDVDHYDTKTGWKTFRAACKKYGELPDTYKSSSRGEDSPSGIYFYMVPAGKKWDGKLGDDVDIIQRTHRYAVVYPSRLPGDDGEVREYKWYQTIDFEETMDTPPIFDEIDYVPDPYTLPMLPQKWQDGLMRDNGRVRAQVKDGEINTAVQARAWLEENMLGYDNLPSSEVARVTDHETLMEEFSSGAHDGMVARLHQIVMLGVEGHHGLKTGIDSIQRAFMEEVCGEMDEEKERRDRSDARDEFNRALLGEIQKTKADLDAGYMEISSVGGYRAEDMDVDTSAVIEGLVSRMALRRSIVIEHDTFMDNDTGRAEMLMHGWGDVLTPIAETKKDWAFWNEAKSRLEVIDDGPMHKLWKAGVLIPLKEAAERYFETADALEAAGNDDDKKNRKIAIDLARRAQTAGNQSQISPGLKTAHGSSDNKVSRACFDQAINLLGVKNGVIEINGPGEVEVGVIRKGKMSDRILLNTEVAYVQGATHPLWDDYLATFLPDEEYREFVQQTLGYCLFGRNKERLMIFLQGGTSTGKSTFIRAVQTAIGQYAATVSANAIFKEKSDAAPNPETMSVLSKRIVFSSEIGQNHRLHSDVIKRVTGEDEITGRGLYENSMTTAIPMFTPIIATNSMPTIQDGDEALWRRLLVLPFDVKIEEGDEKSVRIEDDEKALEAVLAWLVDGMDLYLKHRLKNRPERVIERGKEFIQGTSEFQQFLADMTEPDVEGKITKDKLYSLYLAWTVAENLPPRDVATKKVFSDRMKANGYPTHRTSGRVKGETSPRSYRIYRGLRTRSEETLK